MGFPPEVYLIGAQKSGTSTLAHLLDQHPGITVSNPKEPQFFTKNWNKGFNWYQSNFYGDTNNIWIDASTSYSMAPINSLYDNARSNVPEKVYSINPNAKFIYILRNPIDRAFSGYLHDLRKGREKDKFGKCVKDADFIHLEISNYYEQILLWLEYFPLESFLILSFDELKNDYQTVAKECFNFIGVDSAHDLKLDSIKNQASNLSSLGFNIRTMIYKYPKVSNLTKKVPKSLKAKIIGSSRNIPKINEDDKKYLKEYFYDSNIKLRNLTNFDISDWNI